MKTKLALCAVLVSLALAMPGSAQDVNLNAGRLHGSPATLGTCSSTHSLTAANDLLACGKLEVDAAAYFDSTLSGAAISQTGIYTMTATDGGTSWFTVRRYTDDGIHLSPVATEGEAQNNIIITTNANSNKDHDHDTASANPTLFIHSNTDPDAVGGNTQWLSLSHNQTDGVISTGTGDINIGGVTGTELVGAVKVTQTPTTCAANVCAYTANTHTILLTSDATGGADILTVVDGADGQRQTFILVVDGGTDVSVDVSGGTDSTLADAGDSATYEFDVTTDTWWLVCSTGI